MPKGLHPSRETRRKMSLAHMGNKHSLGFRHSEETRNKLSLARMGNQNNLGHKATAETRAKMSKARKGIPLSLEHRVQISEAKLGSKNPMYGKHPAEETRVKLRIALVGNQRSLGHRHTEKSKAKMSQATSGVNNPNYGIPLSEERKVELRQVNLGNKYALGSIRSEETKALVSQAQKRLWTDPEYRDKMRKVLMASYHITPNKPERAVEAILENAYPGEWEFVGDGQLIIVGKCPDFVNINGKKLIIEVFGDYFHKGENPQDRIDLFKQDGYSTLVIWEKELKEPEKVLVKIKNFA